VSDRSLPNPIRNRHAAKHFRRRRRRFARRLLDEAYAEYLREIALRNDNQSNSFSISVPSPPPPPPPPQLLSPSPNQVLSSTSPLVEPNSPHSALTSRIFPDSPPPSIRSFSFPSYSPIYSPEEPLRPTSPANSTTSNVEFIDELPIPSPRPRYYYCYVQTPKVLFI